MLMHADAAAAWVQWVTAAIAGGAGWFERGQVLEARRTREAVAQPNVVVFVDFNPENWHYLDLVIKNFGETPAFSIKLTLPPLDVVPWENLTTGAISSVRLVPGPTVFREERRVTRGNFHLRRIRAGVAGAAIDDVVCIETAQPRPIAAGSTV